MIKDAMVEVHKGGHSVLESFDLTITAHTHVGAQMCIIYCSQEVYNLAEVTTALSVVVHTCVHY